MTQWWRSVCAGGVVPIWSSAMLRWLAGCCECVVPAPGRLLVDADLVDVAALRGCVLGVLPIFLQ